MAKTTKTLDRVRQHKKAMIEALEKSLGIVTVAAKQVGIHRDSHYNWMKSDPEYAMAVNSIENIAIDFAESKLHKQIEKGDTTATIFYLKTKAKNRGYIERTEITGKDGESLSFKMELSPEQTALLDNLTK